MTWPTTKLSDVCRIVSGSTPRTGQTEYWDGEISWVTPKDLSNLPGMYICETAQRITQAGYKSCSTELLPPGSVLLSSRAPIGYVAINAVPMCTNQGFKSFIPDRERLHSEYLYFWLRANRDYLQSIGNGATFKELSKATVERIEIPLPPIAEQKRIAAILDEANALRRKRREAIAKLDALLESVFLDMFGDAVTNPKGWKTVALADLIEDGLQNGLYKPSSSYGQGTPILRIDAFYDGEITDLSSLKRLQITQAEKLLYGLRENDIVINRVNSLSHLGKSAIVPQLQEATVFESNMMRFSVKLKQLRPNFLIQFLQTKHIKNQILSRAKNAVNQSSINQQDVKDLNIFLPPLLIQEEFETRMTAIRAMREQSQASLNRLDALFTTLQHQAFNSQSTGIPAEKVLQPCLTLDF